MSEEQTDNTAVMMPDKYLRIVALCSALVLSYVTYASIHVLVVAPSMPTQQLVEAIVCGPLALFAAYYALRPRKATPSSTEVSNADTSSDESPEEA